jgi:hypothetical protein
MFLGSELCFRLQMGLTFWENDFSLSRIDQDAFIRQEWHTDNRIVGLPQTPPVFDFPNLSPVSLLCQ